jgi:hypothetical protein
MTIALDQNDVYWASDSGIWRVGKNGTGFTQYRSGTGRVTALTVGASDVFYGATNGSTASVVRSSKIGANDTTVDSGDPVWSLVIDAGDLYALGATSGGPWRLRTGPLAGGLSTVCTGANLGISTYTAPRMLLDASDFFVSHMLADGQSSAVSRCARSGGDPADIIGLPYSGSQESIEVRSLAFVGSDVYILTGQAVFRMNKDGSGKTEIPMTGIDGDWPAELVADASQLYLVGGYRIFAMPFGGGPARAIAEDARPFGDLHAFALDDVAMYWLKDTPGASGGSSNVTVMKLAK